MNAEHVDLEIRTLLEDWCDFILDGEPSAATMLPPSDEIKLIGADGAGGGFYLWTHDRKVGGGGVVYLSVYGEASRFADSFEDALRIVIAYPTHWLDGLVAADKSRALFDRVIAEGEHELDDETREMRNRIVASLGLNLTGVADAFFNAVNRDPRFAPRLQTTDHPTVAARFAERPYPK